MHGLAVLPILCPTYLRISGVLGLGGGPEACEQEGKKEIISNLEDFGCFAEVSYSFYHVCYYPFLVPSSPCWWQVR